MAKRKPRAVPVDYANVIRSVALTMAAEFPAAGAVAVPVNPSGTVVRWVTR